MSTSVERRLSAALDARADLVQPHDLAPFVDPGPRRRPPRPLVGSLLVAATAAALVAPFVAGAPPRERTPAAPATGASAPEVGNQVGLPPLFPAEERSLGVGETFRFRLGSERGMAFLRFRRGSERDPALLSGSAGEDGIDQGDVNLVVVRGSHQDNPWVPAGGVPSLTPQLVEGAGGQPLLLVSQDGGDSTTVTVFVLRSGRVDTLAQPTGDVPFGTGFRVTGDTRQRYRTWVSEDGGLFTAEQSDDTGVRHQLWRWRVEDGVRLTPDALGEVCMDWDTSPVHYGKC